MSDTDITRPGPLTHGALETTTTVADLAADQDVVDLPTLLRAWAGAVWTDGAAAQPALRAAGKSAMGDPTPHRGL